MNQRLVSAACLLSLVMASAGPANAALPEEAYQSFPYSGLILTDTQVPFDGAVSVAVQIYAVQAGSEALIYEETHPEVLVQAGYFSLVLGAGESGVSTPLVDLLEPDVVHEVALSIDGATLGERGILGAVPFAASAASWIDSMSSTPTMLSRTDGTPTDGRMIHGCSRVGLRLLSVSASGMVSKMVSGRMI